MVKPGGTGTPRAAISARLAPLPPRRSRMAPFPSVSSAPKEYTHFVINHSPTRSIATLVPGALARAQPHAKCQPAGAVENKVDAEKGAEDINAVRGPVPDDDQA